MKRSPVAFSWPQNDKSSTKLEDQVGYTSPPSQLKTPRRGEAEGICGDQILTSIEIMTRVLLRQNHHKAIHNPARAQGGILGSYPEPTIVPSYSHRSTSIRSPSVTTLIRDHPPRMLNSSKVVSLVGPPTSVTKTLREDCLSCAGYSRATWFPQFTDSVMLPDYSHVPNITA